MTEPRISPVPGEAANTSEDDERGVQRAHLAGMAPLDSPNPSDGARAGHGQHLPKRSIFSSVQFSSVKFI